MKLQYTSEGYPYYQADETDTADNLPLPVELPFELAAAKVRRRAPVKEPDPITKAATEMTVGQFLSAMLGKENEERYQLWPEKMVRSGLSLPSDVASGVLPTNFGLRREDFTDIPGEARPNDELIARTQDLAGLAMGGSVAAPKAAVTSGELAISNRATMTKMDRQLMSNRQVQQGMVTAADSEAGTGISALANSVGNEGLAYLLKPKSKVDIIGKENGTVAKNGISELKLDNVSEGYDASRLIYTKDGNIIGAMQVTKIPNTNAYKVANTYVAPEFRRQGIATKLNDKAKELFGNIESSELEASPAGQAFRNSVLRSDNEAGTAIAAVKNAAPFYSTLANVVKSAKMEKGTADQWQGYLRNNGVKADELEWSLGKLPEGQITKADLEKHIGENQVQLKEVNKGSRDTGTVQRDPDGTILPTTTETKFSQWQLPGGENYRELLLTLPRENQPYKLVDKIDGSTVKTFKNRDDAFDYLQSIEGDKVGYEIAPAKGNHNFKSSHWSEPNVLAHVRMNDRIIPPEAGGRNMPLRSLHIEEIQSDWHQKGRKEGYKLSKEQKDKLEPEFNKIDDKLVNSGDEAVLGHPEIREAVKMAVDKKIISKAEGETYLKYADSERVGAVPDAPFKSTWSDVALKRMIREASEKGYDAISWTPGEAQAARYDLSKQIKEIEYIKYPDGSYRLGITDHKGQGVDTPQFAYKANELSDIVGKEVAEKIVNGEGKNFRGHEGKTLSNLDLKIGGEGMKAFYDKMLVDKVNNLAKKYGGKVEQKELPGKPKEGIKYLVIDGNNNILKQFDDKQQALNFVNNSPRTRQLQQEHIKIEQPAQPIHILRLTPELKAQALEKGFPLFSTGFSLTPVSGNPFELDKGKYKLVPIDFDPWSKK